jgi:hypothetical protein
MRGPLKAALGFFGDGGGFFFIELLLTHSAIQAKSWAGPRSFAKAHIHSLRQRFARDEILCGSAVRAVRRKQCCGKPVAGN